MRTDILEFIAISQAVARYQSLVSGTRELAGYFFKATFRGQKCMWEFAENIRNLRLAMKQVKGVNWILYDGLNESQLRSSGRRSMKLCLVE